MDTTFYFLYAVGYVWLLLRGLTSLQRDQIGSLTSIAYLIIIGLALDNVVAASGRFIGEGSLLRHLNLICYWLHAFLTPTLVLFSLGVLRSAGVKGMQSKPALYGAILLTGALIGLEVATVTWGMELKPKMESGVLRYVPADSSGGSGIMVMLVTVVLVVAGAILWKKTQWRWMFIGAAAMAVGSLVPIPAHRSTVMNGLEFVLLTTLVATKWHQDSQITAN
ncbi:hypothetical protein [Novibacillus thermophilus]|uniref:Phospholipid phosphatase n=1 Tax=Novibacillus thermophilus TaxID=1471761 RepID=A0A1U9K4M9_9BACL|nr:hypothetical protein [Novibacillus thermophilus]AQS54970.1 hypothetical protein B0W44_03465 [Novibacillus thermophilus]